MVICFVGKQAPEDRLKWMGNLVVIDMQHGIIRKTTRPDRTWTGVSNSFDVALHSTVCDALAA